MPDYDGGFVERFPGRVPLPFVALWVPTKIEPGMATGRDYCMVFPASRQRKARRSDLRCTGSAEFQPRVSSKEKHPKDRGRPPTGARGDPQSPASVPVLEFGAF
jgi:hypothetical protein